MKICTPMTDVELARLGTEDDAGFGAIETARGRLPLTALTVTTRVTDLVAETELTQTFVNTLAEAIEATYIFPLPDRAAVTRFRMNVGERLIEGVIEERARARQEYERAIDAGHRAAIAEEDRPGVFTIRVGNLAPGDVAVVRLALVGPLPVDGGEVTFRFPLVVAPRYIPGEALPEPRAGAGTQADTDAVPDASRITPPVLLPGFPNPVRLAISVTLDGGGMPIGAVRSSLPTVSDESPGGVGTISLHPGERLDRDFILRWAIGVADVASDGIVVADRDGAEATVLLTLVPPTDEERRRPRGVVFVLDRSASMGGWKMVAARRACARMIDSLSERDQFAVLVFDHQVETPPSVGTGLVRGSDRQRFRVVEFLATVDARGGTEMAEPLRRAVKLLADTDGGSDRTLVLITDGQVGNEDQLLRELAGSLTAVRVFTLGIDTAVNAGFLRRFAAAGGGACELVESEDRLDEVMAKLHRRIATPCATDLSIRGEGLALEQVSPGRIPALFTGAPVLVAGRTTAGARGAVVVTGRTPGGQPWQRRILLRGSAGDSAAAMWARARIRDLEDGYASGDHSVEAEIVAVSVRHRVLSRFTAFVAIDRTEVVVRGGNPRAIVQPVELPAGWPEPFTLTNAHPLRARALPRRATPAGLVETFAGKLGGPGSRGARALRQRLASPPASVDGTPYRARARDIADAIDRAAAASDRCALDLALARLVELIEDLRSIGGFEALILALDRIAEELRRELGGSPETWRERAAELRDAGASKPGQARSFWK